MENNYKMEINIIKSQFFEKVSNIDKYVIRMIKRKSKKVEIVNIKNEKI